MYSRRCGQRSHLLSRLGLEGAAVVVSSRKQRNVDEAAEKLMSKGIEVMGVVCHVSNPQHRHDLIEKTVQNMLWSVAS
ncbi:unnamed protein product [Musa acuminata subsp. malaccensis]|uniref:(wild Malaysian banana) hypothetical protein n=1 Tax=Musa acuminata subsp. malaccensis TaxID=214687 RepID=A0A804HSX4_MUSAM|nr:unnamed protein product [Musa acuminata subsp. malaccensis]